MTAAAERLSGAIGDRYHIERELAQGGMATVFVAEDVRHRRKVAIKVLHPELSAVLGPDRFLKEIELTANLQHPHILPLFDSGSADGLLYYVMPFVEGETLRSRLAREHQLPIADAVRIATEIADALEYAHKRHIIHRDIKPENILLQEGRVLVADFGIALAVEQAGGSRITQTGMSLGTPQYMAPEQAMGDRGADHRADIYTLGAVTYEMLAGEAPFTGPTAQAIIARVMTEKARPVGALRDTVPATVAGAVNAALQKLPADRPSSAAEFARLLNAPPSESARERPHRRSNRSALIGSAALVLLAAAAGGFLAGKRQAPDAESSMPSRLALLAPNLGGTGISALHRLIALTPDGEGVLFVTQSAQAYNALVYQRFDADAPTVIQGGTDVLDPEVSTDGRWVFGWGLPGRAASEAFPVRIPLGGGTPTRMSDQINSLHSSWTADGSLWFTRRNSGGLRRVHPDGSITSVLGDSGNGLILQQILDDGRKALMVRSALGASTGPALIKDLKSGAEAVLADLPVVEMRYTAGHMVYARGDGTLWAAPYDDARERFSAPPVQIATGVSLTGNGIAQFAAARNGTVAYIPEEPRELVFADRNGGFRPATAERRNFHAPQFSPDGRRIAMDYTGADGRDVWILSLAQGTLSRATFEQDGHDATWMPDGQFITYTSFKSGPFGVFRAKPGSAEKPESLMVSTHLGYTGRWLRDASGLVTTATDLVTRSSSDIAFIGDGGHGPIAPVVVDPFLTQFPAVSPDSRWLAFVSDQSGNQEVYVRPFHGGGEDVLVSQKGGTEPMWSPDGRELFYRGTAEGHFDMIAASVRTTPDFEVLSRRALFSMADIAPANPHANYDISPDGKTFVLVRRSPATRIMVIQNLAALVARLRGTEAPGAK